ncbi:MAG: hypothetical protein HOQ24_17375 [Mycobacteriaceae bacterium]|nr:hypothetical protein [Mycobacteriaceae bacterium]
MDNSIHRRMRRDIRNLVPLWRRMVTELPQVRLDGVDENSLAGVERARYRLYRRVIEIRDAQLVLRPYIPPEIPGWALAAARARGLDPVTSDVLLEAAELGAALDAYRAGRQHHAGVVDVVLPRCDAAAPDVLAEVRRLVQVDTALRGDPDVVVLRRRAEGEAARATGGGP